MEMNNQNGGFGWMDDALEHHGVDGMSWGKRRGPPYPLNKESKKANREAAKKDRATKKRSKEIAKTKKRIANNEAKKARETKKSEDKAKKEANEIAKKKAKYSRDAKTLYNHREIFTYEEISQALNKFDWENRMKDYMDKDFDRAKKNIRSFADYSKTVVEFANTAIDGYNVIASLNKHFGGDMKPIQTYKKEQKQDNKDDKK